ncbi:hypothetical protein WJX72_001413 [[Myrmecia] bisecta]|uniref:EF-hand domain-containing protein n=1 Tax=[Myrmecia] bisecta TaxID=41462 RepID=A0AAW1Q6I1_9CHLO
MLLDFSKPQVQPDSHEQLAEETHFSVDEVYALEELFREVSNTLHKDGLIHKDEFALALFKTANRSNLFAERVFDLFDTKQNDVIDFGEFTRALSVFHPRAPLQEKATFAFRLYDLGTTGAIERGEVMRFLVALLSDNPAISLDESELESIINQTFEEADIAGDGKINPDEWQILVQKNPTIINYMTLPVLSELTTKYPSFAFNTTRQ